MRRRPWLFTLVFGTFALGGACVPSEFVDLGSNVDAGGPAQGSGDPPDAAAGASSSATDGASQESSSGADAFAADGAPSGVCLANPMFTGAPTDAGGIPPGNSTSTRLPAWQVCAGIVDVDPGVCSLAPPQGSTTYIGLPLLPLVQSTPATSVSTALAAALPPGSYPFSIELGLAVTTLPRGGFGFGLSGPATLTIYGSASPCGRDEALWSQSIANIDSFSRYAGVLTPARAFSDLVLVASLPSASTAQPAQGAYVVVGDFLSAPCE